MQIAYGGIAAHQLNWPVGKLCRFEKNGIVAFVHAEKENQRYSVMKSDELPLEFFNHELMDVDSENDKEVVLFLEKWGFMFSPLRNDPKCEYAHSFLNRDAINEFACAVNKTEELHDLDVAGELLPNRRNRNDFDHVISLEEAKSSIIIMQLIVSELTQFIGDENYLFRSEFFVNACASNPHIACNKKNVTVVHDNGNIPGGGLLVSAICNQIIECIADENPWKKCECEGCGKWFKYQHTNSRSRSPHRDSKYCSVKCSNRQRKRNQRLAASSRADHGL